MKVDFQSNEDCKMYVTNGEHKIMFPNIIWVKGDAVSLWTSHRGDPPHLILDGRDAQLTYYKGPDTIYGYEIIVSKKE